MVVKILDSAIENKIARENIVSRHNNMAIRIVIDVRGLLTTEVINFQLTSKFCRIIFFAKMYREYISKKRYEKESNTFKNDWKQFGLLGEI